MNDDREMLAFVDLGEQAIAFLDSPLGKTLLGMAQQEVSGAVSDMLEADPEDKKAMRQIQLKMQLGAKFEEWLRYLIVQGGQSMQALKKPGDD